MSNPTPPSGSPYTPRSSNSSSSSPSSLPSGAIITNDLTSSSSATPFSTSPPLPPASSSSRWSFYRWRSESDAFNRTMRHELNAMSNVSASARGPISSSELPPEWNYLGNCFTSELKWSLGYGTFSGVGSYLLLRRMRLGGPLGAIGGVMLGVVGGMIYSNSAVNECGRRMIMMDGERAKQARER